MKYFLDSANFKEIKESLESYALDGVTTNPAILARDLPKGMSLLEGLREIRRLTEGKLMFVQATSAEREGMVRDARAICRALGGALSIKLPATPEGFAAAKVLVSEKVSVTVTAVYSTSQALLAGAVGADFAAPYISHIDNMSLDGAALAGEMARQLDLHGKSTEVLAASFRTASQVERCIAGGVSAVTVTADMLKTLASHTGTWAEVENLGSKWSERFDGDIGEIIER